MIYFYIKSRADIKIKGRQTPTDFDLQALNSYKESPIFTVKNLGDLHVSAKVAAYIDEVEKELFRPSHEYIYIYAQTANAI